MLFEKCFRCFETGTEFGGLSDCSTKKLWFGFAPIFETNRILSFLKQSNNFRNVSSCWCYQEGNTAKNFSIKGWHTQKPTKKTSHSLLRVICGLFPKIQTEQGSGITYFTWIDLKLNSHFERFWLGEWTNGRFNMRACSTK